MKHSVSAPSTLSLLMALSAMFAVTPPAEAALSARSDITSGAEAYATGTHTLTSSDMRRGPKKNPKCISKSEFKKIKMGMSVSKVRSIVGSKGIKVPIDGVIVNPGPTPPKQKYFRLAFAKCSKSLDFVIPIPSASATFTKGKKKTVAKDWNYA